MTIRSLDARDAEPLASFLAALRPRDLLDRFHAPSRAAAEWLLGELTAFGDHGALVSVDDVGALVGLLDYAPCGEDAELGIVVVAARRRLGLGTALTAASLTLLAARGVRAARAFVRRDNRPALRILSRLRFARTGADEGVLTYVRRLAE
ncbi:MAG: GNAT family N-acetyltransferase [Candidatus Eremiobacteraeota bacterium]|nr:GNAT family N-acetyltransferase [Candidatus Eremiobacteraeota bacterium]